MESENYALYWFPMNKNGTTASTKDWILITILALIWGGSFLFGRILMLEWPPFTVVFFRVGIAALTLWLFLAATGRKFPFNANLISAIAIMGILNNVIPFSLILVGQREIGSGLASVVNAMTPIWTLIIANFFTTDEKFSANKIIGILFGFAGVAVLIGGDLVQGLTASAWAQVAVLGATISYGFAGVFGKRFREHDPIVISTGQLTASSIIMLPIMFALEDPFSISAPDTEIILSTLGLSILCTAIAYVLFFRILASAGATNVSLVTFLVPVSAILLGIVWLGETLTAGNIFGMTLIVLGLILVDGRLFRRLKA
ncbi:MAG: DMT family transporter [Pseudomonadota bacterium]